MSASLAGCGASSNTATSSFGSEQALSSGGSRASAFSSDSSSGYRIGAQDVLEISVQDVPDLKNRTVQVADTGTINLPYVNEVRVAGKTTRQVERDLTAKLGVYLQNPSVQVSLTKNNSRQVTIAGAVKKPGAYPLQGRTSLLQAIAMAGDLDDASDSTVLILRQAGNKQSAAKFDVSAIQSGKSPDPALKAGDRIIAGTSAIKKGWSNFLKALPIAGAFAIL